MSFVRQEARDTIWRVREIVASLVLGVSCMWLALGTGLTVWLGYAGIIVSAGLMIVGIQRARFRTGGGGPGVLAVDEGQIGYFGPLTGGVVSIADLTRLTLDRASRPSHWILSAEGAPDLAIPVNAEGVESLFDVFAQLPGLRTSRVLAELDAKSKTRVVLWERTPAMRLRTN